jgi:periplasmic copper chaperone A
MTRIQTSPIPNIIPLPMSVIMLVTFRVARSRLYIKIGSSLLFRRILEITTLKLAATLIAAFVAPVACTGAFAGDYKVGTLEIGNPWSRATPGGTTIGAGYMTIRNTGTASDRLIGGTTDVANDFQFHQTTKEGDVSKMHEMKSGVEIKPGETVEFKPGSTHVMFVKLKHPLRQHDVIKGTLVFEKAGTIEIEYTVGGIGAQTGDQHTHGGTR